MFLEASKLPARALGGMAVLSVVAVVIAVVAQHSFDVRPCPWCVLQRGIFLVLAAVSGLGWLIARKRTARQAVLVGCALICLAGLTAAVFQHEVASQTASCKLGLADKLLEVLNLEELWPQVFMVTGNCADAAAYHLLGMPYEVWSGLLFASFGALCVVALGKR